MCRHTNLVPDLSEAKNVLIFKSNSFELLSSQFCWKKLTSFSLFVIYLWLMQCFIFCCIFPFCWVSHFQSYLKIGHKNSRSWQRAFNVFVFLKLKSIFLFLQNYRKMNWSVFIYFWTEEVEQFYTLGTNSTKLHEMVTILKLEVVLFILCRISEIITIDCWRFSNLWFNLSTTTFYKWMKTNWICSF